MKRLNELYSFLNFLLIAMNFEEGLSLGVLHIPLAENMKELVVWSLITRPMNMVRACHRHIFWQGPTTMDILAEKNEPSPNLYTSNDLSDTF